MQEEHELAKEELGKQIYSFKKEAASKSEKLKVQDEKLEELEQVVQKQRDILQNKKKQLVCVMCLCFNWCGLCCDVNKHNQLVYQEILVTKFLSADDMCGKLGLD